MFYCDGCVNVNPTRKAPFINNLIEAGWGFYRAVGRVFCPECIAKKKLKLDDESGELYK